MRHAKTALMLLRFGIGLYLIFTAVTRLMGLQAAGSFYSVYGMLDQGMAVNQSAFSIGASIFLGLLGLLLLSGRLLVVAGVLVVIIGLASGIGEIIASQTLPLVMADRFLRLSNGVRDVLVLASTGGAIAALDSYVRHRRYRDLLAEREAAKVTMYREETPTRTTTATTRTGPVVDRDDLPPRPLR